MNIILPLFLIISAAQAGLGEFKSLFERHTKLLPYSYEFSIDAQRKPTEVIQTISQSQGLESLSFEKMISLKEVDRFLEKMFAANRQAPHYCHNIVREIADFSAYRAQCRKITSQLLNALKDDSLELSFYHYEGHNRVEGDFQKAKIHALDPKSGESIVLNIDITIQHRAL